MEACERVEGVSDGLFSRSLGKLHRAVEHNQRVKALPQLAACQQLPMRRRLQVLRRLLELLEED